MQFNFLYENQCFKIMTCFLFSTNFFYYYFMRHIYFSNKVKMISIPRFIVLFLVGDMIYKETMIKSYHLDNHKVDINPLLDSESRFLFSNPYFKALIKRVAVLYPHKVHEDYDLSDIISGTEDSDSKEGHEYELLYKKYFSKRIVAQFEPSDVITVFNKTFAIKDSPLFYNSSVRAYEKMILKYKSFFEPQLQQFKIKIKNLYLGMAVH